MNFLSNLWGGIKDTFSDIKSSLGASTIAAFNTLSGQGAGAARNETPQSGGMTRLPAPPVDPFANYRQNQTLMPTMSTPGGPAAINSKGQTVVYNQGGSQNVLATAIANSTPIGGVRPSTYTPTGTSDKKAPAPWTPPVDSFGRTSTPTQGNPYFDAGGNWIVPKTGFTGVTGTGGGGLSTTPATTGASGLAGQDPGGFRGAAQGTTGGIYNQPTSDEETRKKQGEGSTVINPTAQAYNAMGAQGVQNPVQAPPVPDTIDAGFITATQETLNKTLNSTLSEQDKQAVYAQLQTNLLAAKQKLDQANPIPENPVVDTREQLEWMNSQADPFGVKQAIDQFRAEQTNLGQLQSQRVELQKSVQALNDAYRPIIDEIKQNPNLPKALARRKLEGLAFTQKETLQGFLDQLAIVNQQVDDQNEMVNRAFDIVTFSEGRANRAQDNMRANLSLMVNSGAIGGFTGADIMNYSQALGISTNTLQKMREEALKPKTSQQIIGTSETGYYSVVTDDVTGKVVSKTQIMGGTGSGGNTTPSSNLQLYVPTLQAALSSGATPEEALFAVISVAANFGDKISDADRAKFLMEARRLASQAAAQTQATQPKDPISSFLFGGSSQTTANSTPAFLGGTKTTTSAPAPVSSTQPIFNITKKVI